MHALIVDDSKTARYALRQLLDKQKVSVDMVESAEEALDYLHQKSLPDEAPDLIFMDHMMPGMDGFDAVKELKSNPATAAIPIVMYTSTQGGMYFGQARALGAADVINKPATAEDLREVLRRLQEQRQVAAAKALQTTAKPAPTAKLRSVPAGDEDVASASMVPEFEPETEDAALYVEAADPARVSRAGYWLAALLILPLLYLGSRYFTLTQQNAQLLQQRSAGIKAIEWAFNQANEFPFGDIPFNDLRAQQVQDLVTQLKAAGFRGRVVLSSHVGVYCLRRETPPGRAPVLVPAVADSALTECAELGQAGDLQQLSAAQSPAFRRFLQESPLLGEAIQVEVQPHGAELPLVEYSTDVRALEWNRIANRNQRVEIVLEPAAL